MFRRGSNTGASSTGARFKRPPRVGNLAQPFAKATSGVHFAVPCPTGRVQNVRRGIFYASDLTESNEAKQFQKEFSDLDKQCIIRFPLKYAAILRRRLREVQEQGMNGSTSGEGGGSTQTAGSHSSLGLIITPTAKEDYRIFHVSIDDSVSGGTNEKGENVILKTKKHLIGVLVELPCIIESYKTFDGDLLFKSADVSQMIYVYDPTVEDFDINKIKYSNSWEWPAGLTPATYRIRTRKFRNFEVFDKADIQIGEREIVELIKGLDRDFVELQTVSEADMNAQLEAFSAGGVPSEPNVTFVVGPNDNIFDEDAFEGSDLSDRLFMEDFDAEDDTDELFNVNGQMEGLDGYKVDEFGNVVSLSPQDGYGGGSSSSDMESSASDTDRRQRRKEEKKQRKEKRRKKKEKRKRQMDEQTQEQLLIDPNMMPDICQYNGAGGQSLQQQQQQQQQQLHHHQSQFYTEVQY